MNRCLKCGRPCTRASIFCHECKTSLLSSLPDMELAASSPSPVAQESANQRASISSTLVEPLTENLAMPSLSLSAMTAPRPRRHRLVMPVGVRVVLIVLVVVGIISCILASVFLTAKLPQHQTASPVMSAIVASATAPRGESGTPSTSTTPIASVTGTRTGTGTLTPTGASGGKTAGTSTTMTPSATMTLTVLSPCLLQAAPTQLSFTATLIQPNPQGQPITLKTTGGCGWPVAWNVTSDASWVQLSSSSGTDNGSGNSIVATTHSNKVPGTYTAHITFTALDSNNMTVQINPQTITVTLKVIL
jgi:Viral BACON domain